MGVSKKNLEGGWRFFCFKVWGAHKGGLAKIGFENTCSFIFSSPSPSSYEGDFLILKIILREVGIFFCFKMAGAQKGELTKIGFQEGDSTLENQIEYLLLHFLNFTV